MYFHMRFHKGGTLDAMLQELKDRISVLTVLELYGLAESLLSLSGVFDFLTDPKLRFLDMGSWMSFSRRRLFMA